MIVLDSNVISEVMRPRPSPTVSEWMDAAPTSELATTSISIAEIRYSLARLPFGRRRSHLEARFNDLLAHAFQNRIFDFDARAAEAYAELAAARDRTARPFR